MKPQEGEWIVAAWAESHSGPGWANSLIYVLLENRQGAKRLEAIQARDFDDTLHELHAFSRLATERLTSHIEHHYRWPDQEAE